MAIRILLVDDQAPVRKGLSMGLGLETDLCVVGEAGDGQAALALTQALQPDVVVMDVEMPEMDGLTAAERLRQMTAGIAVVILSLHDDPLTRARAAALGALFVPKHEGLGVLVAAIRRAAAPRLVSLS